MKNLKYILSLILFVLLSVGCSEAAPDGTYEVTKVIDGDTFKVNYEGKEETIRLLLVDTPETVHPSKPVQPFGKEASNFMKEKLAGKRVELELDVSERDKYGRILAYAYDLDGNMLNEKLLEKGLARVAYIFPPNTKYVDRFQKIQRDAQKKEAGIWSLENYVTEDGFYQENSEQGNSSPDKEKDSSCNIKGNINSSGEKIYHMPDGQYYEITEPEEMFCSEAEAQEAGFRPSQR
ncbi:thermonuclease family protein [Alkalihalobacillus sp. TS-13]|uniref:thermonuclease family protein n=1 Tax=Alkalihalobacillus sp. TS-13 TaxID=2842455 RepID=UPI001C8888DD|nr:thermonuclease family protein [Alkalihalobacillus sp. TS-13]